MTLSMFFLAFFSCVSFNLINSSLLRPHETRNELSFLHVHFESNAVYVVSISPSSIALLNDNVKLPNGLDMFVVITLERVLPNKVSHCSGANVRSTIDNELWILVNFLSR